MPNEFLADDYNLSSEFQVVEGVPDEVPVFPQALWFGVRPGYGPDNERLTVPTIWIQYQQRYMNSELTGMVAISPESWDKLDEAVRWRIAAWREIYAKRDVPAPGASDNSLRNPGFADGPSPFTQPELSFPRSEGDSDGHGNAG